MNHKYIFLMAIVLLTVSLTLTVSAQTVDSVGAKFTKVLRLMENPDAANSDRVPQMVIGGLDLNQNGKQEFLYVTDNTFTGGRQNYYLGYSLFLYEYDAASTSYKNIWKYSITDTVGGSFPVFCIGDLNGNGKQEIILGVQYGQDLPTKGANPDRLLVFEFGPGAAPTTPTATWNFDAPAGSNTRPSALVVGDVDGDGVQEVGIAFRAFTGGTKGVIIASVTGAFAGPLTTWKKELYDTTTTTASIYGSARMTDLNNNGKKEFTFAYSGSPTVRIYEATGPDTYKLSMWNLKKNTTLTAGNTFAAQEVDINGDGKNEFIFGAQGPVELYVVSGIDSLQRFDSSQTVSRIGKIPNTPVSTINEFRGLTAGDIDGNGKTDIFMCNGGRVWRYEYKGTGAITDSASYNTSIVYQDTTSGTRFRWVTFTGDVWAKSMGITSKDMNGNLKPELLIANQRGGSPDSGKSKIVILEADVATSVELGNDGAVVGTYQLEQNYPNPFNPTTNIKFSLSMKNTVKLEVFDVTGRLVTTLVNGELGAGNHNITFDASKYASGTYIYQLTVGTNLLSKKMTLIK